MCSRSSCRPPRDEPLVAQHRSNVGEAGPIVRENQIGDDEIVVGDRPAFLPYGCEQGVQSLVERGLVVGVGGRLEPVVENVEVLDVVHVELSFAEDTNDHPRPPPSCWLSVLSAAGGLSTAGCDPSTGTGAVCPGRPTTASAREGPDSWRFIWASSSSTCDPPRAESSSFWMSSLRPDRVVTSSSAPEDRSPSRAWERACIWAVLSSARCIARPTSPISSEMPATDSLMRV